MAAKGTALFVLGATEIISSESRPEKNYDNIL
jgi:hypothetical protein